MIFFVIFFLLFELYFVTFRLDGGAAQKKLGAPFRAPSDPMLIQVSLALRGCYVPKKFLTANTKIASLK